MTKAVRIHEAGGPDKLVYEDTAVGDPGPGEVRLRHGAIGLNFIDVYMRAGVYPLTFPAILGMEGAGHIVALGEGVTEFAEGDRVAYSTMTAPGAYAEERLIGADQLVALPDNIDDKTAASVIFQGMTAAYLVSRTYPVKKGDTILMQAAAGGVGQILTQWANHLGATVIGTVGSDEKAALAKKSGCHHVINYQTENFVERVAEITGGAGVNVVYDGVGKDTFDGGLDCLAPLGTMVVFGAASGPVEPVNPMTLAAKGSVYLTRPTLKTHVAKRDDMVALANSLFAVLASGAVKPNCGQEYALADARKAHEDLEARKTTGATVLLP